jgi:hypothetical protein
MLFETTIAAKETTMPRARAIWPFAAVLAAAALARPAQAAPAADDASGFLSGRVETTAGETHTGFLRWGDQEVAWDDLFQSGKIDLPYAENPAVPRESSQAKRFKFMGISMRWGDHDESNSRIVAVRFGDLAAILPRTEGKATLRLKSGAELAVEGYADDVSSDIVVIDGTGHDVELAWDRVAAITFQPVPAGASRGAHRLFGEVETDAGTFAGFIAWDKELGLSTDLLEGEDGGERVKIPMGDVVAINRIGQQRSEVKLRDGRTLTLRGTSHVSRGNRGLLVEDVRYGKVEIPWDTLDKLVLRDTNVSGPGYDDYPARGPLSGTLRTAGGASHDGRLVLDLDEAEGWEMLNGSAKEVSFDIPFYRVATIVPSREDGSVVTLAGGETLDLEEGPDVSEGNAGVLVLGAAALYVPWAEVTEIRFACGR